MLLFVILIFAYFVKIKFFYLVVLCCIANFINGLIPSKAFMILLKNNWYNIIYNYDNNDFLIPKSQKEVKASLIKFCINYYLSTLKSPFVLLSLMYSIFLAYAHFELLDLKLLMYNGAITFLVIEISYVLGMLIYVLRLKIED